MMTFCFNHCLCQVECKDDHCSVLKALLVAHGRLGVSTQYPIILPSEPGAVIVAGVSLKQMVESIPADKNNINIRRLAFSILNNYPLTSFFISEPEIADDEWCTYQLLGQDAEALFWAHKMGWSVVSMPVCDEVKLDQLQLESEKLGKTVNNWHGGNLSFIKGLEAKDENACEQRLVELECLFADKSVSLSEQFKRNFRKAPSGLQELVISKFRDAYAADLLFPSRGDDNLVKYCEGSGNEETYELRSKAMGGMRVYFYSNKDLMIVATLHTKAKSVGVEQSSDINNASAIIRKIKMRINV